MVFSAMGSNGSIQGFANTHRETNANKMCPQSSRAVRHFTHVYLNAQSAVRTPDESQLF